MSRPFVITLPEPDDELRDAIAAALGEKAEIPEPPEHYGVEQVKLIIELWAGGAGAILGTDSLPDVPAHPRSARRPGPRCPSMSPTRSPTRSGMSFHIPDQLTDPRPDLAVACRCRTPLPRNSASRALLSP